jgi:hypothetical protein
VLVGAIAAVREVVRPAELLIEGPVEVRVRGASNEDRLVWIRGVAGAHKAVAVCVPNAGSRERDPAGELVIEGKVVLVNSGQSYFGRQSGNRRHTIREMW